MRVISKSRIVDFSEKYPKAKSPLANWYKIVKGVHWSKFTDVKKTFNTVDSAKVDSGHVVEIFDIGGNKFRLITSIHYNKGRCFILKILTHAEYSENEWKKDL